MRSIVPFFVSVTTAAFVLGCRLPARGTERDAGPAPITVTVTEPDGLARRAAPLSFGMPFPRGSLKTPAPLRLYAAGGTELPVQQRTLARWPDGSTRWLLVDTLVSLAPHQKLPLRLVPQPAGASTGTRVAAPRLHVSEADGAVTIDTGTLRFRTGDKTAALFTVSATTSDTVQAVLRGHLVRNGHRLNVQPPRRVVVVDRGPLRTRLRLEGTYGDGLDYIVRLEAVAGRSFVRILHTLINRRSGTDAGVGGLTLDWQAPAEDGKEAVFGIEGAVEQHRPLPTGGIVLDQPDNLKYRASGRPHAGHLSGWAEIQGLQARMGVAERWFWQQYPQTMRLRSNGITCDLWPTQAGSARMGMGAAITHELIVWRLPAGTGAAAVTAALVQPLAAAVDPAWIARSRALPNALAGVGPGGQFVRRAALAFERTQRRNATEVWDDADGVRCPPPDAQRSRTGAYGMWNWGDWNFPGYHDSTKGCDAWGNLEYDTSQVLALLFAATGRADVRDAMVAAARHFMDVDTIHFHDRHRSWIGMNHPKNPHHFSFALGGVDLGHTWTEGLVSTYYLTGDARSLSAARGIANYLVHRSQQGLVSGNPRQWGWPQIALLAVYDATGDARYRRAAVFYARGGMRVHAPSPPRHWKLGILADALAYTHAATGRADISNWLRHYAKAVAREKPRDARFYPALAYVATLDGNSTLREIALARAARLRPGSWAKPFTIIGRTGFRIYSLLAQPATLAP